MLISSSILQHAVVMTSNNYHQNCYWLLLFANLLHRITHAHFCIIFCAAWSDILTSHFFTAYLNRLDKSNWWLSMIPLVQRRWCIPNRVGSPRFSQNLVLFSEQGFYSSTVMVWTCFLRELNRTSLELKRSCETKSPRQVFAWFWRTRLRFKVRGQKWEQHSNKNSVGCSILLMAEILHHQGWWLSHSLQGFIHPRCCRISSINSRFLVSFSKGCSLEFQKKKAKNPIGSMGLVYLATFTIKKYKIQPFM